MSLDGERKFTGILHDLSTRVQMEDRLREQAALVRLGEMAAVIAHEVKNPLAAVRGAIQVIGKRLPAGSREAGVVTDIIARIDTLNQLVKDLLLFARPPQPHLLPLDVSTRARRHGRACSRQDAAHAGVRVTITGQAPPIMADAELLKIVFINLFDQQLAGDERPGRDHGHRRPPATVPVVIVVTRHRARHSSRGSRHGCSRRLSRRNRGEPGWGSPR